MKHEIDLIESAATHDVAPHERADYWAELIQSHHRLRMGYAFPRQRDFDGRTVLRRTANYQIIGWQADAVTYYRSAGHVRADSDGDYRLVLPTTGHVAIWQEDQHALMSPGIGCLVTIDQPFAFTQIGGTKGLTMTIPRCEVDHRLNRAAPSGQRLDFRSGLGRVVADLATGLIAERADLTHHQFDAVSDRLVELLCMHIVGDHPTESRHLTEVESAVRRYIRTHAHDPELSGASVAHALGWSLRQIQLALQHGGTTLRDLIREERLQLARARLQNPAYRHWSIAALAHELGFSSASAFTTSFRCRFGTTPREVRRS
ncbi:AraC family transcriptional regulator [Nocardia sp. NBC_00508]|uniref:AraC family transcriptional regulator n=1 Tax=Nocardia sp. NBC_00508 TaxID=2975992 RepID=UPI002E8011C6|nr:AraC family transcriptional regulator [Nocardia sp. NBC_00508]WUD67320.1 AraC family transcriptional regulator [Nocardia sp. NBC_00508]